MSYNPTSSDNPIDEQSQPQTDDHSGTEAQLLDVVAMPLKGRHLIEASAGTGKTFNITRLYLRLLLEKKLTATVYFIAVIFGLLPNKEGFS